MTETESPHDGGPRAGSGNTSVAETIHRCLDRLTPTERKPARLLLANYPVVGLEPLANFARRAEVSHPTILRFIAKLGFTGYAGFQAELRSELEARLKSPLAKRHGDGAEAGDDDDLLARYAYAAAENIRQSVASMPRSEFEGALALLGETKNTLYLLGGRFTDAVANYMYMHLRVLRPRVYHVSGPPVSWSEYVLDMDRRSVLVVFDIRRYQEDLIRFADEAAERGARIVLVTDNWLSPIAAHAEYVLATRIEVPSNWDSVVAMMTLMEALIAALNNRQWPRLEGRIRELERMRDHFESGGPLERKPEKD
jgi:DNA-binding MurR/RpiR family transcriptional regulator